VQPGPLPAEKNGFITFGCLNNFCKVTAETLALWAGVLTAVKNSRLILLAAHGGHRETICAYCQQRGIDPERIEFVQFQPRGGYLAVYRRIDIGLDTLPYNGHTTSLDSFWMGVPVVTRVGKTVVGRAGWSQLCHLGLKDLAADGPAGDQRFVEVAAELANDLPRLGNLRRELRDRIAASPLMDGRKFARNMEGAYREMWAHYAAKE
jgi:predicted O-linked N-acetylglucosamine transferase (SPINDLY family)